MIDECNAIPYTVFTRSCKSNFVDNTSKSSAFCPAVFGHSLSGNFLIYQCQRDLNTHTVQRGAFTRTFYWCEVSNFLPVQWCTHLTDDVCDDGALLRTCFSGAHVCNVMMVRCVRCSMLRTLRSVSLIISALLSLCLYTCNSSLQLFYKHGR